MTLAAILAFLRAPARDRWLLRAPVGLYAGWLTAAAVVAFAAMMAGHGFVTGGRGWAFIGIPLALLVAVPVQLRQPMAPEYGAAVAWALFGIAVKNGGSLSGVTILAAVALAVMARAALRGGRHQRT